MNEPFKFSVAAVPQTLLQVDGSTDASKTVLSDAERISAVRAVAIQHDRESNADPNFGGYHSPAFFVDYGKGSGWSARRVMHLAQLLETRIGGTLIPLGAAHSFNPATGIFESLDGLTLFDLTVAYKLRIKELGLSGARLEEFASTIHPYAEENEFYALPFEEKLKRFRS